MMIISLLRSELCRSDDAFPCFSEMKTKDLENWLWLGVLYLIYFGGLD